MWGNIVLEISFLSNYHLGFNNTKTDILIHLTQWQYWWWFWFSYLWGLYFLLFLRIFRFRTLKFRPRIATTLRPHGKWGDLIVCVIPVSWCINIISNSNLILRMIEWQTESSLFTIRVRGKQWYWVYKYDLKTVTDVLTTPKNIGHNKWRVYTPGDLLTSDDYLHVLQLRSHNKWAIKYWKTLIPKILKEEGFSPINSIQENLSSIDFKNLTKPKPISHLEHESQLSNTHGLNLPAILKLIIKKSYLEKLVQRKPQPTAYQLPKKTKVFYSSTGFQPKPFRRLDSGISAIEYVMQIIDSFDPEYLKQLEEYKKFNTVLKRPDKFIWNFTPMNNDQVCWLIPTKAKNNLETLLLNKMKPTQSISAFVTANDRLLNDKLPVTNKVNGDVFENLKININHDNFLEVNRWIRRAHGTISPCRLIKYPLTNLSNIIEPKNELIELLRFRFNSESSNVTHKPFSHNNFLIMRQKRYKRIKLMPLRIKKQRDKLTGTFTKHSAIKYSKNMTLLNNKIFQEVDSKHVNLKYKFIKKFKKQAEQVPLTLWKRLLRTRRTLVLPAHVNITVITNSFDVVHSWFLPGLGLKLDCVPGRATHHVLHIDSVGFYYGQCAEICGRYHHHMPIRVCALPFEHFLVWWHSFGVPKLLFTKSDQKYLTKNYALRKYTW